MNKLQASAGASGGIVTAEVGSILADPTMIKIPRPKFTINRTNGNHNGDASIDASKGSAPPPLYQHLVSGSNATNSGVPSVYPYQEPPVDYWSANNSNSSSNTDLRNVTKQMDKECKI